ncbi:MAG: cyclodeaminase/cyclohydrolase family protein [Gaiellaceae bacterium]
MAPSPRLLDLTLAEWLESLAAQETLAGGPALAVALGASAAALAMAARVSKSSWPGAGSAVAQAKALLARAAPLAQLDVEAHARALTIRRTAASLPPDRRDWEIGRAFAHAAEPPLEIARVAADVAELAAEVARAAEQRVRPDALAAAALAAGVARGAAALVAANLTAGEGDERVVESARLAEAAERAAASAFSS